MKAADWAEFASWATTIELPKVEFNKNGISIPRPKWIDPGFYIIITNEMRQLSNGIFDNSHLLWFDLDKKTWEAATEDFYYHPLYDYINFPRRIGAMGLYYCKDIFREDFNINLNKYSIWIDNIDNNDLFTRLIYSFKDDDFSNVNEKEKHNVIGII